MIRARFSFEERTDHVECSLEFSTEGLTPDSEYEYFGDVVVPVLRRLRAIEAASRKPIVLRSNHEGLWETIVQNEKGYPS
jgi:hypothetical protein